MSSGSHLSKELHDLVKAIGETRSKQEEDKIVIKELTKLKNKLQEKNIPPKIMKEHLLRAIYIEMLGHDASFAHIQAVNLTQSKILQLKKMGYLCCSLFLDNNSELLILLVSTLQRDLASSNIHEIVIALTAVSKLISQSFVSALIEPIIKLLNHQTDIIRKKSLMVLQKIKQLVPNVISDSDYDEKARRGLMDKEPSVIGAALNLYHEELKKGAIQRYKGMADNFVIILKQIIEHKLHKDFDYHRFPAPWLQIKILQILSILGANDLKVSEQVYEVLGSALRRADDTTINIGYAVTYQCVKTIASLYPNQQLLEQAANSVSRFLKSDNNNLKYLGINALIQIVSINPKYVIDHQMVIVDCLESPDDTLKKETLELLFKMTNENNIEIILTKLTQFLKTSVDPAFRKDLFYKISILNEKHAPTQEWFIRTANTVFEYGSEFMDNDVLNNFFKLIIDNFNDIGNEFGEFIIDIYLEILTKPNQSDNMIKLIVWVLGEIGSQTYENNSQKLAEITQIVIRCLDNQFEDYMTNSWIITALAKLQSSRGFQLFDETTAVFQKFSKSKYIDCQQRAQDFSKLAKYNAALKKSSFITVDKSLSFLNGYVSAEIQRGVPSYNSSLSIKAAGLGGAAAETTLNFEPYKDEKYLQRTATKVTTTTEGTVVTTKEETTGIKVRGPAKWTEEGYKDDKPVVAPLKQPPQTMGMGSSGAANTLTGQITTSKTMQGMGSSSMGQQSASSSNPSQNYNPPPVRIPEKKEDPNLKEKQNLANSLFGGVATKTAQTSMFNQPKKPIQQQPPQQPVQLSVQQPPQQPQKQTMNLLDIDEPVQAQKPPQVISPQTQYTVQQNPQQYPTQQQIPKVQQPVQWAPQPQLQPPRPQVPQQPQQQVLQRPVQNINLFDSTPSQQVPAAQSKPMNVVSPFQPLKINVDAYQKYWEQIQIEHEETIQSKIKSQSDFNYMIQMLNIQIVEIIDQEFICAGQNIGTKSIILCYAITNSNGQLQINLKGPDRNDLNNFMTIIKRNFV